MTIGIVANLASQPTQIARQDLPQQVTLRQKLRTNAAPETVGIVYRAATNYRFQVGDCLLTAVTRAETVSGTLQNPTELQHQLVLVAGPGQQDQFAVIDQEIVARDGTITRDSVNVLIT